ncbi:MAG: class I SAM-dependent methyltransferase [Opitutales bacterium]|nr:class I SAM-dependent methyltransferase [Opitutales bacterium]
MDTPTIEYYNQNAPNLAETYGIVGGAWHNRLNHALRRAETVLDIGCGTGRDLAHVLMSGKDAYGADPSAPMLEEAANHLSSMGLDATGRLFQTGLPEPAGLPLTEFDAIVACASLMHLPSQDLATSLKSIHSLLKTGGVFLLLTPASRPQIDAGTRRDPTQRLFTELSREVLEPLLGETGFAIESTIAMPDGLGRAGYTWLSIQCLKK